MRELTLQEISDLADGACILASGGGGSIEMKKPLIDLLAREKPVRLADVDEIDDDAWLAVPAAAGSPTSTSAPDKTIKQLADASTAAFDALAKRTGRKLTATVAIETGVGNTLIPLLVAARRGIAVVDGAGARRSVPSLTMCTFAEVPIAPVELVNLKNCAVSYEVPGAAAAEEPMMAIVSTDEFNHLGGIAFWPMEGRTAKKHVSRNTVTFTQKLGAALRTARAEGRDAVETVRRRLRGYLLFNGRITEIDQRTSGSFDFVVVKMENGRGETFRLFAQNETLIAWSSRKPHPVAMLPDLISYLTDDGEVLTNADLSPSGPYRDKTIAVIGSPCPKDLRTRQIELSALDALHGLGYGGPYVPIQFLQDTTVKAPRVLRQPSAAPLRPTHRWWRRFRHR